MATLDCQTNESREDDQHSYYIELLAHVCKCKSTCSTKKSAQRQGCPCRTEGRLCSQHCKCGKPSKPCKNKLQLPIPHKQLSTQSEETERNKENADVVTFIETLDESMVRSLARRALQQGIGSMDKDYIQSLLLMEDEVPSPGSPHVGNISLSAPDTPSWSSTWCKCGRCSEMPRAIENKCCKRKDCITSKRRFTKLCLDPEVLELCIKNRADIRNDREDNCTSAFRKAAYRQYILDKHGRLGKGNRKVAPSCVVLAVRKMYPSPTGVYMGFKEH